MDQCKNFESYMFSCSNGANIIVEAEEKIKAIEIFQNDFKMLFESDWKVFRINTRVDIEGNYIRY